MFFWLCFGVLVLFDEFSVLIANSVFYFIFAFWYGRCNFDYVQCCVILLFMVI